MIKEVDIEDPNVERVMQINAPHFDPSKPIKMFRFRTPPVVENGIVWLKHWVEQEKAEPFYQAFPVLETEIDLVNIPGPGEIALNSRTVPFPHRALKPGERWQKNLIMGVWEAVNDAAPKGDPTANKLDQILAKLDKIEKLVS